MTRVKNMDKCEEVKDKSNCAAEETRQKLLEDTTPGLSSVSNVAADSSNKARSVLPPYVLEELSNRNPGDKSFSNTLEITNHLRSEPSGIEPRVTHDYKGAREVYDAKGKERHPGDKARFEGEAATGNTDVDNVYDYTGIVREFFKTEFGKNSIDNKGMKMISTVNYGDNFQNAFWNGKQMTYGHPSESSPFKTFVLLDVTGHEIQHGITQKTSGTLYFGQAGALNEHISDVFGELIQQKHRNQTADQADWVIGDGIWKDGVQGRGIRDMLNPGTAFNDPKIGKDPQPAHMKDYVSTWKDMGGVHYNSGIPNRAFATFAKAVGGNAWDKPGHIWYEATQNIGLWPSFTSFADETIEAAKRLGYQSEVPKLIAAWEGVGIKPSKGAKDTITPRIPIDDSDDIEKDRNGPILPPVPKREAAAVGR